MIGRLARRSLLPFQRAWLRKRVGRLVLEELDGLEIVVLPGVFNPAVFRTSAPLMHALEDHVTPGARVLDIGTGTGVAAIKAAVRGAVVIAVDINPEAVRCTRINALLNHVDDRVEVREGDLFAPIGDDGFDLVVCNPPFFSGEPQHARDAAWRSPDFLERFAQGVSRVLSPRGRVLVVFSSDGEEERLLSAMAANGLAMSALETHDLGSEIITVYQGVVREATT